MESVALKNVLLVDDYQAFLTILAEQLSDNGFSILTAEDGEKALKVLESSRVDLVVTDLHMPVMDGYDLISYLKKNYPVTPIIVVSNFLYPDSERRLRALGVSQYMEKHSFSISALEEMILRSWE